MRQPKLLRAINTTMVINKKIGKIYKLPQAYILGFQIWSFLHIWCFLRYLHSLRHLSLFRDCFELHFLPPFFHHHFPTMHFYSHSYDICFVDELEWFILLIILITLKFTSFVLFGTHFLPHGSSKVLQLPLHLSKLTIIW